MTEGKAPATSKPAKELLALNPQEDVEFKKKVQEVKKRPNKATRFNPGVIYVGHLPPGLVEDQLKSYFVQFGKILRLRLARSKKTGGSKGYAFVEYDCDEVAKIVAETMNNYLMGERLIKCNLVPPEKVHEKMFVGSQRPFKKPKHTAVARYNKTHTAEQVTKLTDKLLRKEAKLRKRLAAHGIDYEFPGFAAQVPEKKKSSDAMNASTCSDDTTPACTPSFFERRKSQVVAAEDVDDEVVVKMPAVKSEGDADEELSSEEEDEDNKEEDDSESEEPTEDNDATEEAEAE